MQRRVPSQQTTRSNPSPCALLGIGTAVPDHAVSQQAILGRLLEELGGARRDAALARRLFQRAQVEERFSCMPRPDPLPPSVAMQVFREEAPRLGLAAASQALSCAGVEPREVTHLVVTTSTGAMTPGPDADLASLLGLRPSTERSLLGFMGCSGAFHGLRVARRAALEAEGARVLLVCVELSSIHFRPRPDPGSLAAHALFGDGAGAVVLASGVAPEGALAELSRAATHLEPGTRDVLTWDLGPDGFDVRLAPELPAVLEKCLWDFVTPLLGGRDPRDVASWATHPGGPAILRAVARSLGLGEPALGTAYEVLRSPGNVSSAAVLFVLERELRRIEAGTEGLMLGFGPGLTLEAMGYRRGGRSWND